ncbi:MFS transporter [Paraburkholderia lycopersici]|uniref:Predicted arabinose efflux permease, MFS family n=1 Tax=Paraburkholderia lycopersici TaxID=416944 RepID=A0A1G6WRV5_9BURK|nr:MFS transporter [Paraburkholderia lycopersici]SDD68598.1 Predicted arabinose efflux permease, MFS family [Paraburkholderia lycopersici]
MKQDRQSDSLTRGVAGLTAGVAAIGAEALVMSPVLEDISASLGASPGTIGVAVAAYGFALTVASPLFALFGHKLDRLTLMLSGLALFVLATAGCGLAQGPASLVGARVACGIAAGAYLPACYAFVGDAIPYERRARVMGRIMFGWSLSLVIGVPLGGLVGQLLGWRFAFFAVALVGLAAFLMIAGFRKGTQQSSATGSVGGAVRWPLPRPVWAVFGITFFNMLGFYGVYTYLGTAVRNAQHVGSAGAAAYVLCYGLGLACSTLRGDLLDRLGKVRLLAVALLLLCPLLASQAIAVSHPALLAPAMFVWGVLQGVVLTGISTVLTQQAGATKGMATALNSSLTYLAVAMGATLGGIALERGPGFAGICFVAAGASLLSWMLLRASRISA